MVFVWVVTLIGELFLSFYFLSFINRAYNFIIKLVCVKNIKRIKIILTLKKNELSELITLSERYKGIIAYN